LEPRFLADRMLGGLCRYLRIMGYDCAFAADGDTDDALARRAREEGRVLLTRDRGLDGYQVAAVRRVEQVREVVRAFRLDPFARAFTRCLIDNAVLEVAAPELKRCPACRRDYWPGSHVRRMERVLKTIP
jgi:hypothetical protein